MRAITRDIVGGFIFSSDVKLLLGKGGVYGDAWLVPGGGIEPGESMTAAIKREIFEETGIDISKGKVEQLTDDITGESEKTLRDTGERVLVKMNFFNFIVKLPKTADEINIKAGDDFTDASWFAVEDLPKMELAPPSVTTLQNLGYL